MVGGNTVIEFTLNGTSQYAKTPEDVVKAHLKFFLETNRGDIINNPDYGADLIYFCHGVLDVERKRALDRVVRVAIAVYLPYVRVQKIIVVKSGQGILSFKLEYGLTEDFEDDVLINLNI